MRYFYIGFMILALLLAAGIWNAKEIEQRSAAVAKHLEAAALLLRAGRERVGRNALAAAEAEWANQKEVLSSLISHDDTEAIDAALAETETIPSPLLEQYCVRLLYAVRSLWESDRLSWENIF